MLIDGEKWACEACVRGHRVSGCNHNDRTLVHINKKGRPVSQCPHCRGLRKSRTTHTKCDCGDKKKDHHVTSHAETGAEKSEHKCRCLHGQRCSCALKKEQHLDPVPETGVAPTPCTALTEMRKPRLTSTKSESTLTVFRDGHHKPMHKHNDMAHKCGLPYTIPRHHTIHGTSELAQRSADHLPLATSKNTDTSPCFNLDYESDDWPSQRRVKSEHGSPVFGAMAAPSQINTQISPLDLSSYAAFDTNASSDSLSSFFQEPYQDPWLASPDTDLSTAAGAFNAPPVDWSSFPLSSTGVSTTVSQAPSYASFDFNNVSNPSYPGLTASSSGDISEVDDFGPLPSLGASSNDIHDLHSVSDSSDVDQYRVSSASSFIGLPQAQLLSSNNLESINIDDFLKSANESTAALEQQLQASMAMESKAISAPQQNFSVSQAQSYTTSEPISPQELQMSASQVDLNEMFWASNMLSASIPTSMPTSTAEEPFTQPPWN
ncbi:copper fist DNA binding domain protein [Talaromyces proteolyticus]|uniref:Copper fist DNA binding domain protein n=1 Tax=Talaromyces proteolyticus TaxID=1131652 RepID=A0AAD4L1Q3_9EURO|nr:copper fist DNA binding domain protein [Talaromyces proteolyticus]KAH8705006.1 copper fist DNA binding domain protein [Talaromyces proteolyticus]